MPRSRQGRATLPLVRRSAAAALCVALLAACGSTVTVGQRTSANGGAVDSSGLGLGGLDGQSEAVSPGSATASDGESPASPDAASPEASAEAGPDDSASYDPGTETSSPPTSVVSTKPIEIGALTKDGAGEFQKSLGFEGATTNQTAQIKAIVNYLNDHGGIAGRKISVVLQDIGTSTDIQTVYQTACENFTVDHRVVAVANVLSAAPANFYECLRKKGVFTVSADSTPSAATFKQYSDILYAPSGQNYTRVLSNSVDALSQSGWLTSKSKVGVVAYDTADARGTITNGLRPALARHGLKVDQTAFTTTDTSLAGAYPGIVVKFKTAGVDRVFFGPGGQPIYFALLAAQQGYHPRYELSSYEYPQLLTQNLPANQLEGSAGIGWQPFLDLKAGDWSKLKTPGQAQCRTWLAKDNQNLSTGTNMAIGAWICDNWSFLKVVLGRAAAISAPAVRAVVNTLGTGFASAATFSTHFSSTQTDGASQGRLLSYDAGCDCFKYGASTTLR